MYAPIIKSARQVREHLIDANYTAVLLTDIENNTKIQYTHILVVFRRGEQDPIAFLTSEAKSKQMDPIFEGIEFKEEPGSHFLCAFVGDVHRNFGASDDWADLEQFEARALELIQGYLRDWLSSRRVGAS